MSLRTIKKLFRRYLRSHRYYAIARQVMLLGQFATRRPDEPDLKIFRSLGSRNEGLVIDIGANGGQSAIAFAFLLPKFQIISFEPNPALWPELEFVRKCIGKRFSYRPVGLGSCSGQLTLFVPRFDDFPITSRASLSRAEAEMHCQQLQGDFPRPLALAETTVEVVTFDSLSLSPSAVKIDVEGFELEVLRGMIDTISSARPLMMLECNSQDQACMKLLTELNYGIFYRHARTGSLIDAKPEGARNWFAVPRERAGELKIN